MRRYRGFTFTELIVTVSAVCAVLAVAVVIILPPMSRARSGRRTVCSTNLLGLYKAIYTYSISNRDVFPIAGEVTPDGSAIGFSDGDRLLGTGAVLDDNVTASLWMMVREGAMSTQNFICPKTSDKPDDLVDHRSGEVKAVVLMDTYDFAGRANLSYSPINMYHSAVGSAWSENVRSDWVLAADNNNNNYTGAPVRHTLSHGASLNDTMLMENSLNHSDDEGQNLLFGDGHVEFAMDPFQGPDQDNIFAMTIGGKNAPPTLGHDDGDAATDPKVAERDVVLLPLSGNGGGAGSLDPAD